MCGLRRATRRGTGGVVGSKGGAMLVGAEAGRRRAPDMNELPAWLSDPLRSLVRTRPRVQSAERRRRPTADWDAWAVRHLTREYWGAPGGGGPGWFSCVRSWSAARPQGKLDLTPTLEELIRAIVRLVVKETIVHQLDDAGSRTPVATRRHINTTAIRQGKDDGDKLRLYHVVDLALTRFDFDIARNRIGYDIPALDTHVRAAFDALHDTAAAPGRDPAALRAHVVWLKAQLRAFVRRTLFVPWHVVIRMPNPGAHLSQVEFAARTFVTGLPAPDLSFLALDSPNPHSDALLLWLRQLLHEVNKGRWGALVRCFSALQLRVDLGEDPRYQLAFAITSVFLFAAVYAADAPVEDPARVQDAIGTVADAQAREPPPNFHFLVFRDLLDLYLEPSTTPSVELQHRINRALPPVEPPSWVDALPPEIDALATPPFDHCPTTPPTVVEDPRVYRPHDDIM